jgi:PilZ domain
MPVWPDDNRRFDRIKTPVGVWVAWELDGARTVSRVQDLNPGGLFIVTPAPLKIGTVFAVLLVVPEGEVRGHATVRSVADGQGMGVEITAMGASDGARYLALVERLLSAQTSRADAPTE